MKSPRPKPVNVAIACIIASYVVSTVQMFNSLNLSDWGNVIQMIIVSLAECAIVFGIYVRKNWVRWLFVTTIVIWFVNLVEHRLSGQVRFHGIAFLLLGLNLVFSVVSVVLLFYPESNAWFRKQSMPIALEPQAKS
jgi:hypothetical protein